MAEDIVIRAETLGKKYLIGHQQRREGYVTLRDVLMRGVKGVKRRAGDLMRGRSPLAGDIEEFWALIDASFEVKRGEVLGIIGRNGAGKSTLLKILSRITEPSAGRVTIKGRVGSLLEVGTGFHPELTGRENIYLNGAILGMSRAEVRRNFDEIVSFAEVERFLDTPVKRYSSGMYVRLAFAVSAHLEPEILIVDEVLAVGDTEFQKKCLGKMHDVAGHGRTVLFVSHSMAAIDQLCSRAILLTAGRVEATGKPKDIIERYAQHAASCGTVTFKPVMDRPSITQVNIDENALMRGDLVVEIAFESPTPIQAPIGGLVLKSLSGQVVWGSNGRYHPRAGGQQSYSAGVLRARSEALPLLPGQYTLSAWLASWHENYDAKIDALNIHFGTEYDDPRRPPTSLVGHLDWPATWSVADAAMSMTA